MVVGIGTDIIEIDRIDKACKKDKFLHKVFTDNEIKYFIDRKWNIQSAAGIFCAKEAVSKALGTGISGFGWTDIEILRNQSGKPYVVLHKGAAEVLNSIQGDIVTLSISHCTKYAIAFALVECCK